jgi:AAA family ATP:ADP antiporter
MFNERQGKRLFGIISAGTNLGAMTGSGLSAGLVHLVDSAYILVIAAIFIECVVRGVRYLDRTRIDTLNEYGKKTNKFNEGRSKNWDHINSVNVNYVNHEDDWLIENKITKKFINKKRYYFYIIGIGMYVTILSVSSTTLYFRQAELAQDLFLCGEDRTKFFASIDFVVNMLTLLIQIFFTGFLMRRFGVSIVLAILPLFGIIGFGLLAWMPTFIVFIIFRVLFRVSNFSFAKPAREVLFTVLNSKYRIKNFIDTVIYRVGDQLGVFAYVGMGAMGLSFSAISFAMAPLAVFWLLDGVWLGKKKEKLAMMQSDRNKP